MARQLPAGMRNNNPGNIKFVGQPGTRPSVNTDQGDPQAVYPDAQTGMAAMYRLLAKKYRGGKITADQIIAGNGGWTPGNHQAAANVARAAGIGPHDDIGLTDPAKAAKFMRGLLLQEHGEASNAYPDSMITGAITGAGGGAMDQAPAQAKQYALPKAQAVGGAGVYQPPAPEPSNTPANATTSPSSVTPAYGENQPPEVAAAQPAPSTPYFLGGTKLGGTKAPENWLEVLGKGVMDAAQQPLPQPRKGGITYPKAAIADAQVVPSVAPIDPNKRMQLAQIMAQLNAGRLY